MTSGKKPVRGAHDDSHRAPSKSDAPAQLATARDLAVGRVRIGNDKPINSQMKRMKKAHQKRGQIPQAIQITTPPIPGVEPIAMWVATEINHLHGAVAPSVELANNALNWVMGAIAAQVADGDMVSAKVDKRTRISTKVVKRARSEADDEGGDADGDAVPSEESDDEAGDAQLDNVSGGGGTDVELTEDGAYSDVTGHDAVSEQKHSG